jgi:transposase InsO family protein
MQRWALTLSNYDYQLEYRQGKNIGHADGLSRLPLPETPTFVPTPEEVILSLGVIDESPITAEHIRKWTLSDPVLSQVRHFVEHGWPIATPDGLSPYSSRKSEISVQQGILMWGNRVIVPPQAREILLNELHMTHPGIVRMKGLARSHLWWPGLDQEIENKVRDCHMCQTHNKMPTQASLHPWEWPGRPWHRIHIDYIGPFEGHMILVIVDSHSKYIDAHVTNSTSTAVTITKLQQTFAIFGLPVTIVSDNATGFMSDDFKAFCQINGIKHITSAPYHPASNGQAERMVQTVKIALKKTTGLLENRLFQFLARYRVTPQTTTGEAPSDLLLKHKPRTKLDFIQPSIESRVISSQAKNCDQRNRVARDRMFYAGDSVWVVNFQGSPKWMPGVLENKTGPVSFSVRLPDGRLWRRHVDHIRCRRPEEETQPTPTQKLQIPFPMPPPSTRGESVSATASAPPHRKEEKVAPAAAIRENLPDNSTSGVVTRKSSRVVKPPDKLNL